MKPTIGKNSQIITVPTKSVTKRKINTHSTNPTGIKNSMLLFLGKIDFDTKKVPELTNATKKMKVGSSIKTKLGLIDK